MIWENDATALSTASLGVNSVLSIRWRHILDHWVMHRFTMPIYIDNCTGMAFDYQRDALLNNLGIRFRVFRSCLKAVHSQRLRCVSEETLWPFFDQRLGRFSTKTLADFRPKFLVSFRPKLWPISDQKKLKLDSAHGPWRAPFWRDAGVRKFLRGAFPIFTGSLARFSTEACFFFAEN